MYNPFALYESAGGPPPPNVAHFRRPYEYSSSASNYNTNLNYHRLLRGYGNYYYPHRNLYNSHHHLHRRNPFAPVGLDESRSLPSSVTSFYNPQSTLSRLGSLSQQSSWTHLVPPSGANTTFYGPAAPPPPHLMGGGLVGGYGVVGGGGYGFGGSGGLVGGLGTTSSHIPLQASSSVPLNPLPLPPLLQQRRLLAVSEMEAHERKIVEEFARLLDKSKQLFNGLR